MSTLEYLLTDNITDPRKEGYPCFAVGFGTGNNIWSHRVMNSMGEVVGSAFSAIEQTTSGSYRHGMLGDATINYGLGDYNETQSQFSTESYTFSGTYQQSIHNNDQYPINSCVDTSSKGYKMGQQPQGSAHFKASHGIYLINQVLPEGVRPRRYFTINNNTFGENQNLLKIAGRYIDSVNLASYRPSGFTTRTQCYGAAGYNEKTKTLVAIFGDSTGTHDVVVWRGAIDLNSCNSLATFFGSATVTGYSLALTNDSQSYYDKTVVVGDNDYVFVGYRTGNDIRSAYINIANGTATTGSTVSGTTSYGQANGSYYYTKMQLSWDGKWAFIYQPYYYYGCGVCGYIVSTEDPTVYFTYQNTTSSGGGAIFPWRKSSFVHFVGDNTDSQGINIAQISLDTTARTGAGTKTVYTNSGASSVAIGGAIPDNRIRYGLHGGYYSTCYPRFYTVNWWPINGKFSYEGVIR